MNTVATNLRFPKEEYQEIKLLALSEGKSTAALIREAVAQYKNKKMTSTARINLAEKMKKAAVRIDIPVLDLVRKGRKFE